MKDMNDIERMFREMAVAAGCTDEELSAGPRCFGGCGTPVARLAAECPECCTARRQKEHQAGLRVSLDSIPEGMRWVSFKELDAKRYVRDAQALATARTIPRYFRARTGPKLITLVGPPGAGKTLLATAMLRACIDMGFSCESETRDKFLARGARYYGADKLIERGKRLSFGEHFTELDIARTASVLVLDEIGHIADPLYAMFPMVDDRLQRGRPTIFTTPHADSASLAASCGDAGLARRVFDDALVIQVRKVAA